MAAGHTHNSSSTSLFSKSTAAAFVAYCLLLHALISSTPWHETSSSSGVPPPPPPHETAAAATPMALLVEPHGYELEEHFVTTTDGFILRVFRIPGRQATAAAPPSPPLTTANTLNSSSQLSALQAAMNNNTSSTSTSSSMLPRQRPVVFLQHALMDSSAGWLLLGPQRCLALQLVGAGFDVWMGNARGNRYSRNHTVLQPDDPAFWAWSWQQQAEYDLPASISYVLAATQQERLVFVGYSQGTMTALAALANQRQLAAAVSVGILLSPVAFTTGMTSPSFVLSSKLGLDSYGLNNGWLEWGSHQPYWATICRRFPQACLFFLTSFCGRNPVGNVDARLIPTIFEHLPSGTSVQVMAHWAQGIRRRDSQFLYAFDYGTDCSSNSAAASTCSNTSSGMSSSPVDAIHTRPPTASLAGDCLDYSSSKGRPVCNQHAYGQQLPPFYNLSTITTPLALFSGGRDTISTLPDVELLKQQLQPGVLQLHQHLPDYGHLDFELGTDAPEVLYPAILQLARKFSGRA